MHFRVAEESFEATPGILIRMSLNNHQAWKRRLKFLEVNQDSSESVYVGNNCLLKPLVKLSASAHRQLPDPPWGFAGPPEVFQIRLVTQGVQRSPETAVLKGH